MKKIFIKNYNKKYYIKRYSAGYWFACSIEIIAIILMGIGIFEIEILNKFNPATFLLQFGGFLFVIGSFLYTKGIQHNI